jgi:hypothetical protein
MLEAVCPSSNTKIKKYKIIITSSGIFVKGKPFDFRQIPHSLLANSALCKKKSIRAKKMIKILAK